MRIRGKKRLYHSQLLYGIGLGEFVKKFSGNASPVPSQAATGIQKPYSKEKPCPPLKALRVDKKTLSIFCS